jgi:hypothetical protein
VAIPPGPTPDFIVIQAHLALGGFDEFLNDPTRPRHSHHLDQRGILGRKDDGALQFGWVAHTAPQQQPTAPAGGQRVGQGKPTSVVPTWPFRPVAGTEVRLTVLRLGGQDGCHLPLSPMQPNVFLAGDRQDIDLRLGFQPHPHPAIIPIHAIARHRLGGYTSCERALQHLSRQLRLGRRAPVLGNARLPATVAVVGPLLRQIELPMQQGVPELAGITQKAADLAVLNASSRATILPGDARRLAAFFEKTGFVNHQQGLRVVQMLEDIAVQFFANSLGGPQRTAQQVLKAIRHGVVADLGQPPAVLALSRAQQPAQIGHGLLPGLGALEIGCQAALNIGRIGRSPLDRGDVLVHTGSTWFQRRHHDYSPHQETQQHDTNERI